MASINMSGRQSFILNDIKDEIRNGGDVTHIVNIKVSNQRSRDEGNRIRSAIFKKISWRPITKTIDGIDVTLTWRTSAQRSSAYYHCNSPYVNRMVIKHTKLLLEDILREIDRDFDNVFTNGITGLAFIVTEPALYRRPILEDDDIGHVNITEDSGEDDVL